MWKPLLFAALLLTLSNGAQANGILRIVVRKGLSGDMGDAPNPGTLANTGRGVVTTTTTTPSNAANPAAAANNIALATGGQQPVVPASVCSNAKSPKVASAAAAAGTRFTASLSGLKNIKPNTTGVAAAVESPARATYTLLLDEPNQRASWTLELCDVPAYVASHLHTGSPAADFPPPLIPLEPYVKPSNPFAPPNLLPQLCPPQDIKGCSYTAQGSFTSNDIAPLAGREPVGDREVPSVRNFAEFVRALKAGKIYINVHSKLQPAGLIRGNLQMGADGSGGPTMSGASMGNAGMAGTTTTGTTTTGTTTAGNVAGPTGTGSDTAAISTGTGTGTGTVTGTGTGQAGGATGTGVGTGTGTSTGSGSAGGLGPSTGGLGPGLTGSGVGSGTVGGGTGTGIGTGTGSSAGTGADTRAIGGVGSNSGGAGGAGAGVGAGGGAGSGSGAGGAGGGGGGGSP